MLFRSPDPGRQSSVQFLWLSYHSSQNAARQVPAGPLFVWLVFASFSGFILVFSSAPRGLLPGIFEIHTGGIKALALTATAGINLRFPGGSFERKVSPDFAQGAGLLFPFSGIRAHSRGFSTRFHSLVVGKARLWAPSPHCLPPCEFIDNFNSRGKSPVRI